VRLRASRADPDPSDIAASLSPRRRAALGLVACLALAACGELPLAVTGSPASGVVFSRMVGDAVELARARIEDGAIVALTHTPDRDEAWPHWSELSRRLVFEVGAINGRSSSDLRLWVPNTGEEIAISETPNRSERWPIWSPTRRELAFAFVGPGGSGIALYDVDTASARVLVQAEGPEAYLRPTFSPDGGRIVAQRRGPGGRGSELWLLRDGSPPQPLTRGVEWLDIKAWFTRGGDRVVFTRRPSGGQGWYDIQDVGVETRDVRRLVHSEKADNHSALPSPTRDEFAFVSDRDGNFDLFLARLDGRDVKPLTRSERHEFAPRWSADGERLLVTVAESDYGMPRLSNPDALRATRVVVLDRSGGVLFETAGFMPDWMPPW
jgi:TolB protein